MKTLSEVCREIERIRAAVDAIEVKGSQNRTLATYAFEKCSNAIDMLHDFIKETEDVIKDEPTDQ